MKIKKLLTLFTLISIAGFSSAFSVEDGCPNREEFESVKDESQNRYKEAYPTCNFELHELPESNYLMLVRTVAAKNEQIAEAAKSMGLLPEEGETESCLFLKEYVQERMAREYPNCERFKTTPPELKKDWDDLLRVNIIIRAAKRDHMEIVRAALVDLDTDQNFHGMTLFDIAEMEGLENLLEELKAMKEKAEAHDEL